ncbi:MAG: hypothetical protein F9K18_10775 [Thermoanaerobaculia bacterium]|nr:MAG: hypothetical protein F9K18_10775 [Thermoanaerobaculia bacterium]
MRTSLITCVAVTIVATMVSACGGAADKGAAATEPTAAPAAAAVAPPAAAAVDDAPKFAGKWMSDGGQMTEYAYDAGKLYVLFGSERNECTLADGGISYRASGMTVRMKYRFVDADTIEYTDPTMPAWSLVQKRQ